MAADDSTTSRPGTSLAHRPGAAPTPWRGDEHLVQVEAAVEAGLSRSQTELDLYTHGFSAGMTVEDPLDGAIVARGRTVLKEGELRRSLRPALQYLTIPADAFALRVHDGSFELRVAKHAAEASRPALDSAKLALRIWLVAGLLGVLSYALVAPAAAGLLWGVGLLLGGWQLRRGTASGRAMLAGRLAVALGMLAQAEKIILPPLDAPTEDLVVRDPR
jgi:hypothetical protein